MPHKAPRSRILQRLGRRIRAARTEKGLSQEGLAFNAGLDRSYVSGLERGDFNPSVLSLAKLAKALGLTISALLGDD